MENRAAPAPINYQPNPAFKGLGEAYEFLAPAMIKLIHANRPSLSRELVEEAVQDAFVEYLQPGGPTLDVNRPFHQQLKHASNRADWRVRDRLRTDARHHRHTTSLEALEEEETRHGRSREKDRSFPDPADKIIDTIDNGIAIRAAKENLPPREWAILVLKHVHDLPAEEVAAVLNAVGDYKKLTGPAVDTRAWRARNASKKAIEEKNLLHRPR